MRRVTTLKGRVSPVPADRKISFDVRADDSTTGITIDVAEDGSFEYVIPVSGERVFVAMWSQHTDAPVVVVDGVAPPATTVDLGVVKIDAGVTLDVRLCDPEGRALAGVRVECLDSSCIAAARRPTPRAGSASRTSRVTRCAASR